MSELRAAAERCRKVEVNASAQDLCWISRVYDPQWNGGVKDIDWYRDLRRVAAAYNAEHDTTPLDVTTFREVTGRDSDFYIDEKMRWAVKYSSASGVSLRFYNGSGTVLPLPHINTVGLFKTLLVGLTGKETTNG